MYQTLVHDNWECDTGERTQLHRRIELYRQALRRCAARTREERQRRIEAEQIASEKDRAIATVCHDLRTPLNAIAGWAQIAASAPHDSGTVREALSRIELNAQSQAMLIDEMLDIAKSANGSLRISHFAVDLRSCVESALSTSQPAAITKGVRIEYDPPTYPVIVQGDPMGLQRIVWNVLSNALKFTPANGHIAVELQPQGTTVMLRISDTGCGIDSELLPRIFDRFEQGRDARDGVGLGLSIVRRLVEQHSGTVAAYSAGDGLGATFTVSIPLAQEAIDTDPGHS